MAIPRATLVSRLEAIKAAYASGVFSVSHQGTFTQFRSAEDMSRIIASLEAEIAALDGTPKKSRVSYIEQTCKGL